MQFSEFRNRSSLVWSAVLAALLFWVGDSLLDGIFFEGTGYYAELIPDEPKELWMRLLLVSVLPVAVTADPPEPATEPLNSAGAAPAAPADCIPSTGTSTSRTPSTPMPTCRSTRAVIARSAADSPGPICATWTSAARCWVRD